MGRALTSGPKDVLANHQASQIFAREAGEHSAESCLNQSQSLTPPNCLRHLKVPPKVITKHKLSIMNDSVLSITEQEGKNPQTHTCYIPNES